jgi:cobalt-zinc-cadmium efflux system outer membrane protein
MFIDSAIHVWRRPRVLLALVACLALPADAIGAQAAPRPAVLTLRDLLDSVQASHPTLLAAQSRVRAAEGSRATARAFGNPMIAYQVDQTPFPGGKPLPGMDREAMTTATLPLEFLYQRRPRIARANAEVRAAEADAVGARQRLELDAASAYYGVVLAQVQSATTHDLLAWLDTLVVYNRSRVQEGAAAEADLIRTELERDRVAAEASMQDASLARGRALLGAFLSATPTTDHTILVAVDDTPMPFPAMPASASGAAGGGGPFIPLQFSVDNRPDVRAARERVSASTAAVGSERSMIVRQLGAMIGTMQTGNTTSMIAGLSVPLPIFDQNRGEVQRANAERDAASFDLATQERMAAAELKGAYDAARILTDRAMALSRNDSTGFLERADESRRIALGAYREGAVPLFQVIDAARSWAEARTTYYRTIVAQHQSVLTLIVAQGVDLFSALPISTSRGGSLR